jgi:predicted amidohydrolase YtcJ
MSIAVVNAKSAWSASGKIFDGVLVVRGRIAFVGLSDDVMLKVKQLETPVQVIDLRRQLCLYPGFVDSHLHFMDGGRSLTALSLRGCSSRELFVALIRRFIKENVVPPGSWIRGGEWSEVDLAAEPDRTWIDEATTEHHVLLFRFDLHSALCSTSALKLAGISGASENPPGGRIEKDNGGEPTGILRESAINLVKKHWPIEDTAENNTRAAHAAMRYLLSQGVTTCFSMTTLSFSNMGDTLFLADLARQGQLKIRVRNAVALADVPALRELYDRQRDRSADPPWAFSIDHCDSSRGWFLRLGAVKFFADGSLGSKTAAMTEPYTNDKCNCGVLCIPEETLRGGFVTAARSGFQCCCHAIGDRALEIVIQGYENCSDVVGANVARQLRLRVEHCQHVHSVSQLARMADLGVVASVQPCHLLFDGSYVEQLIGAERKNQTYLFKTMREKMVAVAFGSDWMVAPADVVDNLRAAVQRVPLGEDKVWNNQERITPQDALIAHTSAAANAMHEEREVGQVEVGFLGDLTVWDGDILGFLSGNEETKPKLMMTIVGGEVVYDSTGEAAQK